jgi:hypothetical protein
MNIMNSEKYKQAEDDYEEASQSSKKVFNLNIRYPYYEKDQDDQYFGEFHSSILIHFDLINNFIIHFQKFLN